MQKTFIHLILLFVCYASYGQVVCPALTAPQTGEANVPVDGSISWNSVPGVPGYLISLGTTVGGRDILDRRGVGSATTYTPPLGLPENTEIFVTITLFFFDRDDVECPLGSFSTEDVTDPPSCTTPRFPMDGATNVNIGTPIAWNYAPKSTGYRLTIGTSPGATDILNNQDIGSSPLYKTAQDLPVGQEIFVRIVPYNENGSALGNCEEYSFTIGALAVLPQCTTLTSPSNGAINVPLTPLLEWTPIPEADGYRVSIGSSPFVNDVLDNVAFTNNSTFVIDFEPNRTFFTTIVPFNAAGEAIGCTQTTFSTILGCGPFFDNDGELISLNPEIDFPDVVSFCRNQAPYSVATGDIAEGFRWFRVNSDGTEELISSTETVALSEEGTYRYEAYNTASQAGNTIECASSKEFTVVSSETATNVTLDISGQNGNINISVNAEGMGDYEYAIDAPDGPFQNNNAFSNIPIGRHTVYVRDKNGCGTVQETLEPDLTLEGFPKFFTPNGDGVNDFWQFVPAPDVTEIPIETIHIFNRFGTLLTQIDPRTRGWDGRLNGILLPESDYWFRAIGNENQIVKGHFTLKR